MALKSDRTVVTLEDKDLLTLQQILMDGDKGEALVFLQEVIAEKVRCAQEEGHRPEFEGGTGREGVHYLQKGEGHPKSGD
jgi:hypothetical protein